MFIISNVYFQKITFERLQLLTTFKDTAYKFQLKSFECNNVIFFQVFLRKSEKSISGGWGRGGGLLIRVAEGIGKLKKIKQEGGNGMVVWD